MLCFSYWENSGQLQKLEENPANIFAGIVFINALIIWGMQFHFFLFLHTFSFVHNKCCCWHCICIWTFKSIFKENAVKNEFGLELLICVLKKGIFFCLLFIKLKQKIFYPKNFSELKLSLSFIRNKCSLLLFFLLF